MVTQYNVIDTYYNLGVKAIKEISEHISKLDNSDEIVLITERMADNLGIKIDLNQSMNVSIPKYRYRYRNSEGDLLIAKDINYTDLIKALDMGIVKRERIFKKYKQLKLYCANRNNLPMEEFKLSVSMVLAEFKCSNIYELVETFGNNYGFKALEEIKEYLSEECNILNKMTDEVEEELIYIVELMSKITMRKPFIDTQEEYVQERVIKTICECGAFEVREHLNMYGNTLK